MKKIPVFLHIPKNAGTYVLSRNMSLFRFYSLKLGLNKEYQWNLNLRRLHIMKDGIQIATIFAYDPLKVRHNNPNFGSYYDPYVNVVDFDVFLKELLNFNLRIFSIIIQPSNLIHNFFVNSQFQALFKIINKSPVYYTLLREPFERSYSMYSYISGEESKHEKIHKTITSKSFLDYLKSFELEDSWLIRKLNGLSDQSAIKEFDFDRACLILDKFKINDISKVDSLINKVFLECYNITQDIINNLNLDVDTNKNEFKLPFLIDSLDDETRSLFEKRTEFDYRLYKKYIK